MLQIGDDEACVRSNFYSALFICKSYGADELVYCSRGHVDVLPDKIYQEATIHYIVKGDPEKEKITVKEFAVFHKGAEDEKMHK